MVQVTLVQPIVDDGDETVELTQGMDVMLWIVC